MAHFRVAPFAVTDAGTVGTVSINRTHPLSTVRSGPAIRTRTATVSRITQRFIQAAARLGTINAELIVRAGIETLCTHKPGRTDTLSRHPIAVGTVEAFATVRTLQPIPSGLAAIRTHRTGIPGRTNALTRLRIARSTVLAATLRLALFPVRTSWTCFRAEWSSESRRTVTFPGHMIALATVFALTDFGTVLAESIAGTRFLTVATLKASVTLAATIGSITRCTVHTLARLLTVRSPYVRWTANVTGFASKSFVAAAHVRIHTRAVAATCLTLRYAVRFVLIELVADATFLHDSLLVDGARFVHGSDLDAVRGAAWRYAETPLLIPFLVRFLLWGSYRDGNVFHFLTNVRALQVVILDEFGIRQSGAIAVDGHQQYYHREGWYRSA